MANKNYTLLGYPLGHSLSPKLHKYLFELEGISDFSYDLTAISPESFEEQYDKLKSLDGFNITIPYKMKIIDFCDNLDISAKKYGAVNCVKNVNGVYTGYNTDCDGFLRALSSQNVSLSGKVLLLGCGGAGRMMLTEALLCGAEVTVCVRDKSKYTVQSIFAENAEFVSDIDLEKKLKIVTEDEICDDFDLLMNSTPVGMFPNTEFSPISDEIIKRCKAVFDAIYNPTETALIKSAKSFGIKTIGGMSMLVWQAVSAHEIWLGTTHKIPEIDKITERLTFELC